MSTFVLKTKVLMTIPLTGQNFVLKYFVELDAVEPEFNEDMRADIVISVKQAEITEEICRRLHITSEQDARRIFTVLDQNDVH